MMQSIRKRIVAAVLTVLALSISACGGSSGPGPVFVPPPPPPPAPPPPTAFNQFVQDQFAATADNTDPEPVDDEDFAFDEDPAAFDSLLQ